MKQKIYLYLSIFLLITSINLSAQNKLNTSKPVKKCLKFILLNKKQASFTIYALRYINDNYLDKNSKVNILINDYLQSNKMNKSRSFLRLLKPGNYVDSSYFLLCPLIDKITITALYCDIIPIPYDYLDKLKTYSDTDDIYVITHIGMALKFMEENKCLDTADVNNIEIRKTIVKKITNYLDLSKSVNDQYIECVMMLYYIKAGGEVKVEYIDKIIRSQLKDGSWANGKDKDPEKGNDHSTVLALWALCAYEHDGIEKSIWIVK